MKHKIYILSNIIGIILLLSGCDNYLDRELITDLTFEEVTKNYSYSRSRVAAVYSVLAAGFTEIDGAMMASASDESEHTLETSDVQKFNIGSWNAFSNPNDVWASYFTGIRRVNQLLVSLGNIDLDLYKYDPNPEQQAVYKSRLSEIKQWKYEIRFLRAFFYFELVKRYGGVPILTEALSIEDDYSGIERNSLDECIKFITEECDSAAAKLPLTYSTTDLGRATKGAALALKSRVLLYAASELFNNSSWAGSFAHPELISLTGDRTAKWQAAADAAKAVIDLAGTGYSLSSSYSTLFSPTTFSNSEVIFCRRAGASNSFERANYPVGYDYGNSGTTPSQNLVDEYEVKVNSTTAESFNWSNPAHSSNPYADRDPRLGFSILVNNTTWKGRPVECWTGGRDGKPIANSTKTGYYLKKYVNESNNLITGSTSVHTWIFLRLAEIYLNYAEALNECQPGHADIKTYIDKVRQRTGVSMPVLPSGLNQGETRERIRHERRIELAFEDHRFWDLRRWMLAETALSAPLKGVQITKNIDDTFTYNVTDVENRVFNPRMYLYPIQQNEILIAKGLVQNPLW